MIKFKVWIFLVDKNMKSKFGIFSLLINYVPFTHKKYFQSIFYVYKFSI